MLFVRKSVCRLLIIDAFYWPGSSQRFSVFDVTFKGYDLRGCLTTLRMIITVLCGCLRHRKSSITTKPNLTLVKVQIRAPSHNRVHWLSISGLT